MKFVPTQVEGCYELQPTPHVDDRGAFVKMFHDQMFAGHGIAFHLREQYFSRSRPGVLRGMHFQAPPHQHDKLVWCAQGSVLDVVVDLRKGAPTFKRCAAVLLSAEKANAMFIPAGLAHGFFVPDSTALMVYNVSSVHAQSHDLGIRWDSIGFEWPCGKQPLISARDNGFPPLADFDSPFAYDAEAR